MIFHRSRGLEITAHGGLGSCKFPINSKFILAELDYKKNKIHLSDIFNLFFCGDLLQSCLVVFFNDGSGVERAIRLVKSLKAKNVSKLSQFHLTLQVLKEANQIKHFFFLCAFFFGQIHNIIRAVEEDSMYLLRPIHN